MSGNSSEPLIFTSLSTEQNTLQYGSCDFPTSFRGYSKNRKKSLHQSQDYLKTLVKFLSTSTYTRRLRNRTYLCYPWRLDGLTRHDILWNERSLRMLYKPSVTVVRDKKMFQKSRAPLFVKSFFNTWTKINSKFAMRTLFLSPKSSNVNWLPDYVVCHLSDKN